MLFRRRGDHQIRAITERIRVVLSRQPGHNLRVAADSLKIPATDLARLLEGRDDVDHEVLIDVITALAHEAGVDAHWVLTGEYDGAAHRHVLLLGEDRGARGRTAVRDFVQEQFRHIRRDAMWAWLRARKRDRGETPPAKRAMSA